MTLIIDAYAGNINKSGEELCGEIVEIIREGKGVTAIMADGRGSGVAANILASLTVKMLTSMLKRGQSLDDTVQMVMDIEPHESYAGGYTCFTLLEILNNGSVYLAEVDMPAAILLRRGKPVELVRERISLNGKNLQEARLMLQKGDILTVFSAGALKAGMASGLNRGWEREHITAYLQAAYKPDITAERITKLVLSACSSLDNNRPALDLSVLTIRVQQA